MSDKEFTVTQKDAADFLRVSTKSISRYRKKGLPFKMMLNPVTGKQEVRFRMTDLERWDEGRQLLASHGQDGEVYSRHAKSAPPASGRREREREQVEDSAGIDYLAELLEVYKEQTQVLRGQIEDMRQQLARRDRQIDDLMRLMVGLRLEYKPEVEDAPVTPASPVQMGPVTVESNKKSFSREQLAESILRLRRKGKSYQEIAKGLNHINAATLSGDAEWTEREVQSLLPALVDAEGGIGGGTIEL